MNSDDLYALPNKRKHHDGDGKVYEIGSEEECEDEEKGGKEESDGFEDKDANKDLPPGWEKHEGWCDNFIFRINLLSVKLLSVFFR